MTPLISIITPSFNQGAYIAETIESVLNQNYPHLEYIIMDGGSTDNTLDIIRKYESDPRLTWVSQPDGGMSDALNKGFARASGDIQGWLNSDDIFIRQPLAETAQYFAEHPDIDLIYGDVLFTHADGTPSGHIFKARYPFDSINNLSYFAPIPQPGTLWRSSLWEKTGPLREDFQFVMDRDFWQRASCCGQFHYMPGIRATYRLQDNSKSVAETDKQWLELAVLAKEWLDKQPELGIHRNLIESNLALGLARVYKARGENKKARQQAFMALRKASFRLRWFAILALNLDVRLGTGLEGALQNALKLLRQLKQLRRTK